MKYERAMWFLRLACSEETEAAQVIARHDKGGEFIASN